MEFPCTCQIPVGVDLNQEDAKVVLLKNLKCWGWSPISFRLPDVPAPTAQAIRNLFTTSKNSIQVPVPVGVSERLQYRSQESGGGSSSVEPKESLELQFSKIDYSDSVSEPYQQVREWCCALNRIAQEVNRILELPPNLLLVNSNYNVTDNDTKNNDVDEQLDLLRVFYYHSVTQPQLGSSPHTDWGSWTIVWQDNVGGLETLCRHCQKWIPVVVVDDVDDDIDDKESMSTTDTDTWNCIVHVGDLASLAFTTELEDDVTSTATATALVEWPSPCHRVVSPTNHQTRTSLVYFAYPPASISLPQLQTALHGWNPPKGRRLPLSEYYLLKDQSSHSACSTRKDSIIMDQKAMTAYKQLLSRSIQEVIQTKWIQVQRTSNEENIVNT